MIVRLKVIIAVDFDGTIHEFQFYDSPIKSFCYERFGFHFFTGFNSMIVRLKELSASPILSKDSQFQFYDSPIKRQIFRENLHILFCFNSMIVRLKASGEVQKEVDFIGFNSMIVRLKGW